MNKKNSLLLISLFISVGIALGIIGGVHYYESNLEETVNKYLASDSNEVTLLNEEGKETTLPRGSEVLMSNKKQIFNETEYTKIYIDEEVYYVLSDYLVDKKEECVLENELWAYRTCSVYSDSESSKLSGLLEKGQKIEIIGHSEILGDGSVERYEYSDGYVLAKYLTNDEEYAVSENSSDISQEMLKNTENQYGAGAISELDYYENEKVEFEDNVMPDICRSLYLAAGAVQDIDSYIDIAKQSNINTFVIDIKDTQLVTFKSDAMKEYSPSSYEAGLYSKDEFKNYVSKAKDAGIYLVARMTVFKDVHFMEDHPEYAIIDTRDNTPFNYGGSYWPSAYSRGVWEYNVELSKEVVSDIGFNEVQYDYVRFPEEIEYYSDYLNILDLQNKYNETRSQAVQRFLMYAVDEVHKVGAYVSADVFGETSNNYVCSYGQYWPAISNVVDVISAMPYPDHFEDHAYGLSLYSWQDPYDLFVNWGSGVSRMQALTPTPAKIRTYLQGYDTSKYPQTIYDNSKIEEQIRGLIDSDIYDNGYIIWNAGSEVGRYYSYIEAFSKY